MPQENGSGVVESRKKAKASHPGALRAGGVAGEENTVFNDIPFTERRTADRAGTQSEYITTTWIIGWTYQHALMKKDNEAAETTVSVTVNDNVNLTENRKQQLIDTVSKARQYRAGGHS